MGSSNGKLLLVIAIVGESMIRAAYRELNLSLSYLFEGLCLFCSFPSCIVPVFHLVLFVFVHLLKGEMSVNYVCTSEKLFGLDLG